MRLFLRTQNNLTAGRLKEIIFVMRRRKKNSRFLAVSSTVVSRNSIVHLLAVRFVGGCCVPWCGVVAGGHMSFFFLSVRVLFFFVADV